MSTVLALTDINKVFGNLHVLKDVSLTMDEGEVFGFLGPNGAGKTTLIRIILGLIHADGGQVLLNGFDIRHDFTKAIAQVGAVVETPKFFDNLTAYQNLILTKNLHSHVTKNEIERVLTLVGLEARADDKAGTYSLGMKQRLALGRAVLHSPKLVFLDEPMNGLDPQGMMEIRALIHTLKKQGISFFITSHLLHEVELVCDHIAIIKGGSIITSGHLQDLLYNDTETVELVTNQLDIATHSLKQVPFVKSITTLEKTLLVNLERGRSGELIQLLAKQEVNINYLIPKKHSLEEYFLDRVHREDTK